MSPTRILFPESRQTSSLFMVLSHDDFFSFFFFLFFSFYLSSTIRNENMHTHMNMRVLCMARPMGLPILFAFF